MQIFSAYAAESEPPMTVKSCAKTTTLRPSTRPQPVTTPSPRTLFLSMSKSVQRCTTKRSTSTNEPGSSRRSMRSRAVSLPASCCLAIARGAAALEREAVHLVEAGERERRGDALEGRARRARRDDGLDWGRGSSHARALPRGRPRRDCPCACSACALNLLTPVTPSGAHEHRPACTAAHVAPCPPRSLRSGHRASTIITRLLGRRPRRPRPSRGPRAAELGDGRYALAEELGVGGLGRVVRATDRIVGRVVALKT